MATSDSTSRIVEIPLSKGYVAIVDQQDADLASMKWTAQETRAGRTYAIHSTCVKGKKSRVYLHRVIFHRISPQLVRGAIVDHKDNDPLNNTRINLRIATKSENRRNGKQNSDNQTGFKGVSRTSARNGVWDGRYRACITVGGKSVHLGTFDTPQEAYESYCKAAVLHFGEFARVE